MRRLFLITTVILLSGCKLSKSPEATSTTLASGTPVVPSEITGLYTQETIAPESPTGLNYNSSILELGSGHLMSCWFSSGKEVNALTKVLCSEKITDSVWSAPRAVIDGLGKPTASKKHPASSPVLFKDQEGIVWLFYDIEEKNKVTIGTKVSKDNGQTFIDGALLNTEFANLRSKPLQLSSGRFVLPLYKNEPKNSGYVVMLTPDQGIIRDSKTISIPGIDHLAPTLTIKESEQGVNKVFAYLGNETLKNVGVSEYDFIAGSFSAIKPSNIPYIKSPVDVVTTKNNHILMVYNDNTAGRSTLSLAVSEDGISFRKIWDFESESVDVPNPSFIGDQNGLFHITYTTNQMAIRYVVFDNIWLSLKLRPSE